MTTLVHREAKGKADLLDPSTFPFETRLSYPSDPSVPPVQAVYQDGLVEVRTNTDGQEIESITSESWC